MSAEQTVLDGIASHWQIAVPYVIGAVCGFVAGIRIDRLHDIGDNAVDLLAGAVAGVFTFLVAHYLQGIPVPQALVHGAINTVIYIVIIAALMALAAKHWPGFYKRVRSRSGESRPGTLKPDDPDDPTRYL